MYTHLGRVTEFRFCTKVGEAVQYLGAIEGIYDPGWGMVESQNAFVFVDNHDNQRGHGGGGEVITHKDPRNYKMAQAITLGYTYGYPRIMSSFYFDDSEAGPPHEEDYTLANALSYF
jgi:alpha-amylase